MKTTAKTDKSFKCPSPQCGGSAKWVSVSDQIEGVTYTGKRLVCDNDDCTGQSSRKHWDSRDKRKVTYHEL